MANYSVFVIESVIGTGVVGSLKETCHLVLVEVHHTDIAVVIIIIHVICTCFAVCSTFSVHIILRYVTPQGALRSLYFRRSLHRRQEAHQLRRPE